MSKNAIIGIAVVAIVVLGGAGAYFVKMQVDAAKWKEAKEFDKERSWYKKEGLVTSAHFEAVIAGPVDKVEATMWKIEESAKTVKTIVLAELVEEKGNTKRIRMRISAKNLPLQEQVMDFTRQPGEHRVLFKSVKSPAQDIEGSYSFEASPDGQFTRFIYDAKATDKIAVPLPQSVIEGAMRETFVMTVRGISESIGAAG